MVWTVVPEMAEYDQRLRAIAPMGYSLVIHVRNLTPRYYVSTFPQQWVEQYNERQYALFDPVNIWARINTGRIRWSEIDLNGLTSVSAYIMDLARSHGLAYGGGISKNDAESPGTLSFLFGARSDREFSDSELDEIEIIFDLVLAGIDASRPLSEAELAILSDLAFGLPYKTIAHRHGISAETVKKRLERIRDVLGARNSVQAVAIATRRGLILNFPATGPTVPPKG